MSLHNFMKKWLPDYERRYYQTKHNEEQRKTLDYLDGEYHMRFAIHNFPEALQAYTKRVCDWQSNECMAEYGIGMAYLGMESNRAVADRINNAPQPKIEDL